MGCFSVEMTLLLCRPFSSRCFFSNFLNLFRPYVKHRELYVIGSSCRASTSIFTSWILKWYDSPRYSIPKSWCIMPCRWHRQRCQEHEMAHMTCRIKGIIEMFKTSLINSVAYGDTRIFPSRRNWIHWQWLLLAFCIPQITHFHDNLYLLLYCNFSWCGHAVNLQRQPSW